MKKLLLILLCLPMIGFGQNVNIPDANFKAYLVGNNAINTNGDSEIQVSEANSFNGSIICDNMNILDLTGIEAFTALTELFCSYNQITNIDVSANTALIKLHCRGNFPYGNPTSNLDVSSNTALTELDCSENDLPTLDLSQNTSLIYLNCSSNDLPTLDLSQNTSLTYLDCSRSLVLTVLDVSANTAIEYLDCHDNQLSSLDVSNKPSLIYLYCNDNQITALDVSQSSDLIELNCNGNQLTNLDVKNGNNTNFIFFKSNENPNLTCINVDDAIWSTANWIQEWFVFDQQHYFSNNCPPSSIQEYTTNKEFLKATDLLGRETKQTNQPLFYIYDDGTVEKRIVIE